MAIVSPHALPQKRVVIAASQEDVLRGLRLYCVENNHFSVVGLALTSEALLQDIATHTPEAAVIHCDLAGSEMMNILRRIREQSPSTAIIAIGDYTVPSLVNLALRSGAQGYLLAMPLKQQLAAALDVVCSGHFVLDEQLKYLLPLLKSALTPHLV